MANIIEDVKKEAARLENLLRKINIFLANAPEGCLKWQNKNGKTYYYHQFLNNANKKIIVSKSSSYFIQIRKTIRIECRRQK